MPVIFENKESVQKWQTMQREWNSDPILRFHPSELSLPRTELFLLWVKKMAHAHGKFNLNYGPNTGARFHSLLSDNPGLGGVHRIMFIPAL